jgi:hypothetical protein
MAIKSIKTLGGDTTAVPAGYAGEKINGTIITGSLVAATHTNAASITLNKGGYMLYGCVSISTTAGTVTTWALRTEPLFDHCISGTSNAPEVNESRFTQIVPGGTGADNVYSGTLCRYVNVTSDSTPYYLVTFQLANNTGTYSRASDSTFYAIRIY